MFRDKVANSYCRSLLSAQKELGRKIKIFVKIGGQECPGLSRIVLMAVKLCICTKESRIMGWVMSVPLSRDRHTVAIANWRGGVLKAVG